MIFYNVTIFVVAWLTVVVVIFVTAANVLSHLLALPHAVLQSWAKHRDELRMRKASRSSDLAGR